MKIKFSRRKHPPFPGTAKRRNAGDQWKEKRLVKQTFIGKSLRPYFLPLFLFVPQRRDARKYDETQGNEKTSAHTKLSQLLETNDICLF